MNKSGKSPAKPLAALLHKTLHETFARQGFASAEIVTRWGVIVGAELAAHCEPEKIQWRRRQEGEPPEPGILVLRVEGPTAVEVQHLSPVILERVNRFFGWHAVGALRLRQAPLGRGGRAARLPAEPPVRADPAVTACIAASLGEIADEKLRTALAQLGAAVRAQWQSE